MGRTIKDKINGWDISFQWNVHMYCHSLSVKKDQHAFSISCESLASGEANVGIWLSSTELSEDIEAELQRVLLQWTKKFKEKFLIFASNNELVNSKQFVFCV